MSEVVTMTLDQLGVRQNYEPEVPAARHWLLDFAPGRDFLKVALVKEQPSMKALLWRGAEEVDAELDRLIDVYALRHLVEPRGAFEAIFVTGKLLKMQVLLQLGRLQERVEVPLS